MFGIDGSVFQKHKVVVIGAAGKKGNEYLQALIHMPSVKVVAVVINRRSSQLIDSLEMNDIKVIREGNISLLLSTIEFDSAVISLPHNEHYRVSAQLLQSGKYVIKEKPLAMNMVEVNDYYRLIALKNLKPIFTMVQRQIFPSFINAKADLACIGVPIEFYYSYWFSFQSVTSGWRAKMSTAQGGVVLDMGYHAIETICSFFGHDARLDSVDFTYCYPETEQERLEDQAIINMTYSLSQLRGQLFLNRHAKKKSEQFTIIGTLGRMEITPQYYRILNLKTEVIKEMSFVISREEEVEYVLNKAFSCFNYPQELENLFYRHVLVMGIISEIYNTARTERSENNNFHLNRPNSVGKLTFFCNEDVTSNNNQQNQVSQSVDVKNTNNAVFSTYA